MMSPKVAVQSAPRARRTLVPDTNACYDAVADSMANDLSFGSLTLSEKATMKLRLAMRPAPPARACACAGFELSMPAVSSNMKTLHLGLESGILIAAPACVTSLKSWLLLGGAVSKYRCINGSANVDAVFPLELQHADPGKRLWCVHI